jgi:hypothetical protein
MAPRPDRARLHAAADRALDSLNYNVINSKPIRIMWSYRDPYYRKSGLGNIFIKVSAHRSFVTSQVVASQVEALDGSGPLHAAGVAEALRDRAAGSSCGTGQAQRDSQSSEEKQVQRGGARRSTPTHSHAATPEDAAGASSFDTSGQAAGRCRPAGWLGQQQAGLAGAASRRTQHPAAGRPGAQRLR